MPKGVVKQNDFELYQETYSKPFEINLNSHRVANSQKLEYLVAML